MLDLYRNIKNRRLELKLTQSELAERLGYADKSMIAKIEKGIIDLSQSKIEAFAIALDTTPATLMGWTDELPSSPPDPAGLRTDEEMLLSDYNKLNETGKEKALEYVEDLAGNVKYTSTVLDEAEDNSEKVVETEMNEDEKISEIFRNRFVARNGNKNLTPAQMKAIMDILDRNNGNV